jgi:anti-sigma regulatory factor (Ser/Thr protein kinase)
MTATAEPGDLLAMDSTEAGIAEARHAVDAALSRSCPTADRFAVALVLSELLTNAVRHATGHWRLRLRTQRGDVLVEVADDASALPRSRKPDLVGGGGLGMHLVHALASSVEVERNPRGGGKTVRARWIAPAGVAGAAGVG